MINNIDVTLRNGGYQNDFHFPRDYAIKHVQALVESGVEWVEIGYRNGFTALILTNPPSQISVTGWKTTDNGSKQPDSVQSGLMQ